MPKSDRRALPSASSSTFSGFTSLKQQRQQQQQQQQQQKNTQVMLGPAVAANSDVTDIKLTACCTPKNQTVVQGCILVRCKPCCTAVTPLTCAAAGGVCCCAVLPGLRPAGS
jgi:hypothetical protein